MLVPISTTIIVIFSIIDRRKIMQDDNVYLLISRDGTWIMPPTYELLCGSLSSGTIMTIKLEDERYRILLEMDINGKMLQIYLVQKSG